MKLRLIPQRADLSVSYAANDAVLTVDVDGIEDTFDFTGVGDGELSDFSSDVLPVCPIISAMIDAGQITIRAFEYYGAGDQPDAGEREVTI